LSLVIADLADGDLRCHLFNPRIGSALAKLPDHRIGSTEHAGIADHLAGLHVHGFFTRPVDFGALVARVSLLSQSGEDDSPATGALALSPVQREGPRLLQHALRGVLQPRRACSRRRRFSGTLARAFLHDTKRNLSSFRCDVRIEVAKQLLMHEDHKLDRWPK